MSELDELLVADRIDDVSLPNENSSIFGQGVAEQDFISAHKSGRLHHAWLIGGPRGVGKATFAFRMARYLLSFPDPATAPDDAGGIDHASPVFRQIAQGGHPNLLHLARNYDAKTKKFKTKLTIDEIRRTHAFYSMTAGSGRFRITIVDTADDMNANATNALLKILEEPPKDSLFFVLANRPGRLLPTIRSRCRSLSLSALSDDDLCLALENGGRPLPNDDAKRMQLLKLSEGSVRRAMELMGGNSLKSSKLIEDLLGNAANLDWVKVHDLGDQVSRRDNQEQYDLFVDLVLAHIANQVRGQVSGQVRGQNQRVEVLAHWAEVWEKTNNSIQVAESYNLDKKQVVLSVFRSLAPAV